MVSFNTQFGITTNNNRHRHIHRHIFHRHIHVLQSTPTRSPQHNVMSPISIKSECFGSKIRLNFPLLTTPPHLKLRQPHNHNNHHYYTLTIQQQPKNPRKY